MPRPFIATRSYGNVKLFLDRLEIDLRTRGRWADVVMGVADLTIKALHDAAPVGEEGPDDEDTEEPRHMRDAFYTEVVRRGSRPRVLIKNKKWYLRLVLGGRKAIDQRLKPPERRWPLHFYSDGQEYYRWFVKASAPNPFDKRAVQSVRHRTEQLVAERTRRFLAEASAGLKAQ